MGFKKKRDGNNNVIYYKAHIVTKGYSRFAGLDFTETFAPVVRIESIRTLLAIAAFYKLYILHADAKTAFLNGNSDLNSTLSNPKDSWTEVIPTKFYGSENRFMALNKHLISGFCFSVNIFTISASNPVNLTPAST